MGTPLHISCRLGGLGMAHLLIQVGADVDQVNKFGLSPLHEACRDGATDVVRALLGWGANPELRSDFGMAWLPLHIACDFGHKAAAQQLLQ